MELPEIQNLDDLLIDFLKQDQQFVIVEKTRLTKPGENYGSVMLAIRIITKNSENKEEESHVVAKLVPQNGFIKKFMNMPYTFRNEFAFYKTILPCLRQFQMDQGFTKSLNFVPHFYGGRLSLVPSKVADDDAIILLENLKEGGYTLVDRTVGFDLNASQLILTKLAQLHATSLALKILQPEVFDENLTPYLEEFKYPNLDGSFLTSAEFTTATIDLIKDDELSALHLTKIKEVIKLTVDILGKSKNSLDFRQSIFATFVHGDLWVNNIMVKINMNKIVDVKFVDFQLCQYFSLTRDVLFFLFTSVQTPVLQQHLDHLFSFYYNNLISNLTDLKCDVSHFSFDAFKTDMKYVAKKISYSHILGVLHLIFDTKNNTWDTQEMGEEDFLKRVRNSSSEVCKRKACFITREFIQRGWI